MPRSGRYDSGLGSKSQYKTATTLQTQLVEARPPPHLLVEGESSLAGARSQTGGDPVLVATRKVPLTQARRLVVPTCSP